MKLEYKVIEQGTIEGLIRIVEEHLREGWKLAGGVGTSFRPSDTGAFEVGYLQAVTYSPADMTV